jgi:hypothetical protein
MKETFAKIIVKKNRWLLSSLADFLKKDVWNLSKTFNKDSDKITIKIKKQIYNWLIQLWIIKKTEFTYLTLFDYVK